MICPSGDPRRRMPIFGPRHLTPFSTSRSEIRWRDLEPLLRRRVIIDAVRNALEQVVSSRPTVLLLEDLHWIDGQSETAIEALMSLAAGRPLLVLLTWRTEYTPELARRLDVLRIWLRSLDVASANALLDRSARHRP